MKLTAKIISVFLSIAIVISGCMFSSFASEAEKETLLPEFDFGKEQIMQTVSFFRIAGKVLRFLLSDSIPEIEFRSGAAEELCRYISDNSPVDILDIVGNIPVKASLLEKYYTITGTDTAAIRDKIFEIRDEAYLQGDSAKGLIMYFVGAYLSIIEEVDVFSVPFGDEGCSQVGITATFMDGYEETILTDIYLSPDGLVYGPDQKGFQFLGYECSVYDLTIYAAVNCWMRDFGFCLPYDIFCFITPFFNYNTRRFKFDYNGKEWMVQIWKGNYLVSNGAEVGIYNRDPGSIGSFYNCYDEEMPMGLTLSHGDEVIIDTEREHWWINGFKLSSDLIAPSEMTADFYIDFSDNEMASVFAESVNGHYMGDAVCTVDGTKACVTW